MNIKYFMGLLNLKEGFYGRAIVSDLIDNWQQQGLLFILVRRIDHRIEGMIVPKILLISNIKFPYHFTSRIKRNFVGLLAGN